MAADLATLAIVVNADDVTRADAALQRLTTTGARTQQTFAGVTQATTQSGVAHAQTGLAVERHALNINRIERTLEAFSARLLGVNNVLGVMGTAMLNFGAGSMATIGILAGIAAISYAWQKFTEDATKAKEAMIELHKMEANFSPAGQAARSDFLQSERTRLTDLLGAQQSSVGNLNMFPSLGPLGTALSDWITLWQSGQTKEKLADVNTRLTELDKAIAKLTRDLADEAAAKRGFRERQVQVAGFAADVPRAAAASWWDPSVSANATQFVANQRANLAYEVEAEKAKRDYSGDALKYKLAILATERDTAKQSAELVRNAQLTFIAVKNRADAEKSIGGSLIGAVAGRLGSGGSTFSGIAGALMVGNGWGAVAAGVSGVIDSLGHLGEAARQARQQIQPLLDSLRGELAGSSRAQKEIAIYSQTNQQFAALTDAFKKGGLSIAEWKQGLTDALAVQRLHLQALEDDARALNDAIFQDAKVRLLRAQGRTDEADALAQQLAAEKELSDARAKGASDAALAALAEAQRAEAIAAAMVKIKAKIDSLTGTITGLQDFRNSLLLGDATLSPVAKLAEARRQYDEILALAKSGDQTAAGRLPAGAQALLDASRAVNASGAGYQTDLQQVLRDNQDVINKFQDLRTIEQLMLDQLKAIANNTAKIAEVGPGGIITTTGGSGGRGATVAVLQDGFTRLSDRIDATNTKLDTLTTATKRTGDQILTSVLR